LRVQPRLASRGPNEYLIGVPGSRHKLGTPALILDLDRLDANIASMAAFAKAHGYALRPPAKIHKSVEIARLQIAAGAIGQCCATIAEAEAMVKGGIPGVMLFSPVVAEPKLDRLSAMNATVDDLIVVTDSLENIAQLKAAAKRSGRVLKVMIDFEVGGGRTGVVDESQAVALALRVEQTEGLQYVGVQGYVGNHQAIANYDERRIASHNYLAPLVHLVERLSAEGLKPPIVSGGGTGTHEIDADLAVFTEIQTGTYIFMDAYYRRAVLRRNDPHPFQPSLFVRTSVISAAQPGFVITDAGGKEVDGTFGVLAPEIYDGAPPDALYSIVGDDMGRVDFAMEGQQLPVGAVLNVLPPHCYQTLILHPAYHCVRGDDLVDIWPIDALENW